MIELTDEIKEMWAEETSRVQQGHTMLSWEACEMIAWNRIAERLGLNDESVD